MSGLVRRPIKAHKGTIVDGQIVYDKEEDKVDTKILAEQTLQRDPAPKTKTVEPDETVTETAPPPESFSLVAAAPVEATQVRSIDPAPTTTTVEPDEIATDTAPPPEQLSMAVSAADLSKTLQENFAKEQQKSKQKTSDSVNQTFTGTSLENLLSQDSSPEGITKRLEEAGVAKATADSQRSNLQSAYAMSIDQALAKSSLSSDAKKKFKEALLSNVYEREKQFKAESVGKQIAKDIPSVYKPTVKERQELDRLQLILENDPTFKKDIEISRKMNEIRGKELRSYDEKVQEAFKKFGRNSEQFKNAREAFEFQSRLVDKELLPLEKERYKLKNEIESSSAYLNLKQAEDLIYNRKQIRSDVANQFNKGGMSMEQQMSLFEEGGMKDDGLDRDPVSGNEIPPGSLAKEVRDDIPAQLSDGEYVVPADVVQYYGVKFFEELRGEAKRGLAEMEATGRIGGEPVEVDMTMIAFGQKDKDNKEKKATGGVVGFDNGGVSADQKAINASQPTFNPQDYSVLGFTPASPIYQTGQGQGQPQQNKTTMTYYHGQTGESKVITFVNGVVTPASDLQFTQPPWSLNKPTPTQQEVAKDRDDSGGKKSTEPEVPQYLKDVDFTTWKGNNFTGEAKKALGRDMGEKFFGAFSMMALGPAGLLVNEMIDIDGIAKATIMEQAARAAGYIDEADAINKQIADHLENESSFATKKFLESKIGKSVFSGTVTRIKDALNKSNQTWSQIGKTTTTTGGGNGGGGGGVDPNWRKKFASENKTGKDRADDDNPNTSDFSPTVKNQQMASAVKAGVSTKTATGLSGSKMKPGTDVGTGKGGADKIGPQNKGGLIQRPKRRNKK